MDGQYSLNPKELFAGFARDGFPLPATSNLAGLYRATATGDCLEPVIMAGDELYIDRHAVPKHGDLVYFQWPAETVEQFKASDKGAQWFARWGSHDVSRGIKLYWEFPHDAPSVVPRDRYLLTREDLRELTSHKVLGTVRAVVRSGVLLAVLGLADCGACEAPPPSADSLPVASIDPDAASQFLTNFIPGTQAGDTAASATTYVYGAQTTYTATGAPVGIDISGTWTGTVGATGGATPSITIGITRAMGSLAGVTYVTNGPVLEVSSASTSYPNPSVFTLTASDTPPAGTVTYALVATLVGPVSPGFLTSIVLSDCFIKIREIKR